jgi:hypothetical protein
MAHIRKALSANISEEQLAAVKALAARLAGFGYTFDEVVEHCLYHGGKVLQPVAAHCEERAAAVKRVVKVAPVG